MSSKARWSIRTVSGPAPSFAPAMCSACPPGPEFGIASSTTRRASQWISESLAAAERTRPVARLRAEDLRASEKRGRLRLIASSNGRDGSVVIHQDAEIGTTSILTRPLAPCFNAGRLGLRYLCPDTLVQARECRLTRWPSRSASMLRRTSASKVMVRAGNLPGVPCREPPGGLVAQISGPLADLVLTGRGEGALPVEAHVA